MTGSIRKVKNQPNTWELAADAGKKPDGSRYRLYKTIHGTKAHAQRELRRLASEAEQLRMEVATLDLNPVSVGDYLHTYLRDFVLRHRAITTYERYSTVAQRQLIPNIGDVPLPSLAPRHIYDMDIALLEAGLSARTVQIVHTVLSGACREAVKLELIERNPVSSSSRPPAPKPDVYVPEKQLMKAILGVAEAEQHYPFVPLRVKAYTGARRGELMALRWKTWISSVKPCAS